MSAPAWPPVWMTVAPGGDELAALAGFVTAAHGMPPGHADRLAVTLGYLRARLRGFASLGGLAQIDDARRTGRRTPDRPRLGDRAVPRRVRRDAPRPPPPGRRPR